MRDHHSYIKEYIGESDIAGLILVGFGESGAIETGFLHFGGDGAYDAYIVDEDAIIPDHYGKVFELMPYMGDCWLKIYDDTELTFRARAKRISVYRAGEMGCIIQLIERQ